MAHKNNEQNILPHKIRTSEEARNRGRQGGIKSGKSRRTRKTIRETLISMLASPIRKGTPVYQRAKKTLEALGIDYEPIVQDLAMIGLISKAQKDAYAFAVLRDTIGERPVEVVKNIEQKPSITLGLIPMPTEQQSETGEEVK